MRGIDANDKARFFPDLDELAIKKRSRKNCPKVQLQEVALVGLSFLKKDNYKSAYRLSRAPRRRLRRFDSQPFLLTGTAQRTRDWP